MLNSFGSSLTMAASLNAASQAAGTQNGAWVDISAAEGEVVLIAPVGAVTGSVVLKVQDATDTSGTGAADLAGVTTATYNTANSVIKLAFPASSARKAVRAVATVTTGPILMGAAFGYVPGIV
jgi:hypothetical protein